MLFNPPGVSASAKGAAGSARSLNLNAKTGLVEVERHERTCARRGISLGPSCSAGLLDSSGSVGFPVSAGGTPRTH